MPLAQTGSSLPASSAARSDRTVGRSFVRWRFVPRGLLGENKHRERLNECTIVRTSERARARRKRAVCFSFVRFIADAARTAHDRVGDGSWAHCFARSNGSCSSVVRRPNRIRSVRLRCCSRRCCTNGNKTSQRAHQNLDRIRLDFARRK